MGATISKRYSSYKSLQKVFEVLLNFLLNSPQKVLFWIFEILSLRFLTIFFDFVNMGPYGSKLYKTLLLPQITTKYYETSSEFSSQ